MSAPLKRLSSALFAIGGRRELTGWVAALVRAYAAGVALWTVWAAVVARTDVLALSIIFLCLMLVPSFILIKPTPGAGTARVPAGDAFLAAISLGLAVYFIASIETIATRISLFTPLSAIQVGAAFLLIALTLEMTRRTVGLLLALIVVVFIAYNLFGHLIDGPLGHGLITPNHFLDISVFTTDGLFGVAIRVAATYAFLFVLFGTVLEKAGGGAFFFDVAAAVAGRSRGGPAKVAVVSSALFGTMSGSPTSDVVTTGSITIPMMQRLGYRPTLAAGVEVAASTGGSLLPPVMGSAAFIMAEFTGLDYGAIVAAALVPALLYYGGVLLQVHLVALREDLPSLPAERVPPLVTTLRAGWPFAFPLLALAAALAAGFSPTLVAAFATLAVIAAASLSARTRLGPVALFDALAATTVRMIGVTAACAAAGLVIGGITMTGLAAKFSTLAFALAGDSTLVALVLAALVTIVLGLGMPTPSAYVLAAVLVAPTLVNELGVPLMSAHLFLLTFAVLSALTPPVAVAAYAAAAIAQANPLAIAARAVRLAFVAFLLPFAFVTAPGILAPFSSWLAAFHVLTIAAAVVALAVAIEGRWHGPLRPAARALVALLGGALFVPNVGVSLAALTVGAGLAAFAYHRGQRS